MPSETWIPPTGDWGTWTPTEGYIPPTDWTPSTNWVPPTGWMPDQWVPSATWAPPTNWTPPTDWMPPEIENWDPGSWSPPEGWTAEFTPGADYHPPEWLIVDNYWQPEGTWSPPSDWAPPENWIPPDADDWMPTDWTPPENWRPDFIPESDWTPPEWILSENNWAPSGTWAPPPDWVPPVNWIPPEMDEWAPPAAWSGLQQWDANFIPPTDWTPPDWVFEHNSWLPQQDWALPENWMPPSNWMPPLDWMPSDNMMGMIVPPWMPEDSWRPWENWSPNDEWVPPENWRPPEFHIWFCPVDGLEFETVEELDAHIAAEHPEITEHPCPFDFSHGPFSTVAEVDAHIRSEHEGEIPTPDQIPAHMDLFMPTDMLTPPQDWLNTMGLENYQLPPLDNLPFFVPPWLDSSENHWVPPENAPFWTWELDNIEPGSMVNIYIAEGTAPVMNTGEGAWIEDPTATAGYNVLVGGVQIAIDPTATEPLDNVITTVLNLDAMPADITASPDENFYELFQVGTNIPEYIDNAEVGCEVDKDWVTANSMDPATLTIEHYDDDTDTWTELPTVVTGEDENYYYLSANTPSFSVFAVTAEPVAAAAPLPTVPSAVAPPLWVIVVTAIALVGALLVVIWKYMSRGASGTSKSMKRLETSLRKH